MRIIKEINGCFGYLFLLLEYNLLYHCFRFLQVLSKTELIIILIIQIFILIQIYMEINNRPEENNNLINKTKREMDIMNLTQIKNNKNLSNIFLMILMRIIIITGMYINNILISDFLVNFILFSQYCFHS
jgi:hypothetical protein